MKESKTIFTALMLCITLVTVFTSCSDKEDGPTAPAAKSIAGVYNGDMTCSVMGSESVFEDLTVDVAAVDDVTVSVAVSAFGNPPMQVSPILITGVKVSGSDGTYSLASTQFSGTNEAGKAYSGTLQGDFADDVLTLRMNLQYGAMPMPMICTFSAHNQ